MLSDRTTNSLLATLVSIPPLLGIAVLVDRLLPPPPGVPAVVAANDQRLDALHGRSKAPFHEKWGSFERPHAGEDDGAAP